MNWIFEIYGNTYKALTLQGNRRKPRPSFDAETRKLDSGVRRNDD